MPATQTALKPFARLTKEPGSLAIPGPYISVMVIWTGAHIDRPMTFGWTLPDTTKGMNMAMRLVNAVNTCKAACNPVIKTDIGGQTYVDADYPVMGRQMNADLLALGF